MNMSGPPDIHITALHSWGYSIHSHTYYSYAAFYVSINILPLFSHFPLSSVGKMEISSI